VRTLRALGLAALALLVLPLAALAQGDPIPDEPGLPLEPSLILLGLFLPLVVAIVKQAGWPAWVNSLAALIVYLVAGFLYLTIRDVPITFDSYIQNAVGVTAVGYVAYKMFWKALGIEPPIMQATSFIAPPTG
jgi:hypothetical protein